MYLVLYTVNIFDMINTLGCFCVVAYCLFISCFTLMLFIAIMTLYQVVTYEHCFGYNLVPISFQFLQWGGAVALFGTEYSFSVFLFYEFSCVSRFSFVKCQITTHYTQLMWMRVLRVAVLWRIKIIWYDLGPVVTLWLLNCVFVYTHTNRDSSVGIATGYGLEGRASVPGWGKRFSLLHVVQTDSGVHPASYPMGKGGSLPVCKAARAWSWPLTSIYCQGQEWWSYTSTSPYVCRCSAYKLRFFSFTTYVNTWAVP
jgi:hypothetical protein